MHFRGTVAVVLAAAFTAGAMTGALAAWALPWAVFLAWLWKQLHGR